MSKNEEVKKEITNFQCPVCGEFLEIHNGKMYVCPNCHHVEPINDDDNLDFSTINK